MQYRFDNLVLDTAQFALFDGGHKVDIQPQVLRLLLYLIENRDRVIPRNELLRKVFGRRVVTDNALTVRIRAARNAVGDSAEAQAVIATVQGGGYRFVSEVKATSHASAQFTPEASSESPANGLTHLSTAEPIVAVLPFEVVGGGDIESTIARGLAHDLTTRIGRSRTMYVIARGTAFQFDSGMQDVRELGPRLGVRYIVQGAVQISGKKIRVSVALANTESGQEAGSWQFDKSLGDVLVIQDEIAELIVSPIETEIQNQEIQRSILIPSSNLDAWSAYHRGLSHMYRFRMNECDQAEVFFRRSIDLEPTVPRPYAGLSFVNYQRAYLNLDNDRANSLRKAFDYAQEAIAVDPKDPMGHWALSRAQLLGGDLEAARTSVTESAELNPSYATAQYFLGWVAMQLGDYAFSVERVDFSQRLSPCDPLIYGMHGVSAMSLAMMKRNDEALERIRLAEIHPGMHYQAHAMCAVVFSIAGDMPAAIESLQRVRAVNPDYDINEFLSVYAFQKDDEIRRIRHAFEDIKRRIRK